MVKETGPGHAARLAGLDEIEGTPVDDVVRGLAVFDRHSHPTGRMVRIGLKKGGIESPVLHGSANALPLGVRSHTADEAGGEAETPEMPSHVEGRAPQHLAAIRETIEQDFTEDDDGRGLKHSVQFSSVQVGKHITMEVRDTFQDPSTVVAVHAPEIPPGEVKRISRPPPGGLPDRLVHDVGMGIGHQHGRDGTGQHGKVIAAVSGEDRLIGRQPLLLDEELDGVELGGPLGEEHPAGRWRPAHPRCRSGWQTPDGRPEPGGGHPSRPAGQRPEG